MDSEEQKAAKILGEMLTSSMLAAYEKGRLQPYAWERQGLQWLLRFRERNPGVSVGNDWIRDFIDLNAKVIQIDDAKMNFDLRSKYRSAQRPDDGADAVAAWGGGL
ncbi:hypothetical protein [Rhodobium gokarnense]|uniref:HTH CENPB-type domain-containing protein n=1 Tax=Rhodobium gokarnense TaxID=364296 RepID=A0ABT3HH34_9HYPH|nr:hypothetical protein [Rhodobium gokarnense]MCW2309712.1 hypothetical protein [Rhodobium gokarnense]